MDKIYRTHQEFLKEYLSDPKEAAAYLKTAYEDEDPDIFLMALRDVWEAQGGSLKDFPADAHLSKKDFSSIFSKTGSARTRSLKTALHTIGFTFDDASRSIKR